MLSSRVILIRSAMLAIALVVAWLLAGRRLALLLDRAVAVGAASLPTGPLRYDGGGLRIGDQAMTFGGANNLRFDVSFSTDASNQVVLSTGGRSFTMGPRTGAAATSGRTDFDFVPETGDQVSFTTRRSVIAWPTPFEFNFMTSTPWWRRNVYYRLSWQKPSGAKLEMFWRYEQRYFRGSGWTEPEMLWNSRSGLLRVDISGAASASGNAIAEYLARNKGWKPAQYRIQKRVPDADGSSDLIDVIFLEDERGARPGAGRSLRLLVDRASQRVIKELGWQ